MAWIAGIIPGVCFVCFVGTPSAALGQAGPNRRPDAGGARRPATEIRALAIRAELAAVLLQSRRYKEATREYRTLRAADPDNPAYRLGLARSLAWGGRLRDAERELLGLRAVRPGDAAADTLLTSVRLGLKPRVSEAREWMAERPGYAPYRHALARALVRERRADEAVSQYDTLLAGKRSPGLLLERAYVHLERGAFADAATDASASVATGPSPEAYVFLGDLYLRAGDLEAAADTYERARSLSPSDRNVAAAFARLARDRRPPLIAVADVAAGAGWQTAMTSSGDNLGVRYTTLGIRRGLRPQFGIDVGVGGELRWLSERGGSAEAGPGAYAADVSLSREHTRGGLHGGVRARGGVVHHPAGDLLADGSIALGAWAGAWGIGLDLFSGPAYPSLVTMAAFLPSPVDGQQLRERGVAGSIAGPLGSVDVAITGRSTALSDGNVLTSLQALARYPLVPRLALVASGASVAFMRASPLYWDPASYVTQSAGIEYANRRLRGLSVVARAVPGLAWGRERFTAQGGAPSGDTALAFQMTTAAESSYRAERWELGAAVTYGRGRSGGYERTDAVVQFRYLP